MRVNVRDSERVSRAAAVNAVRGEFVGSLTAGNCHDRSNVMDMKESEKIQMRGGRLVVPVLPTDMQ